MRAGPSSTKENQNSREGDTNPSGGPSNWITEPESTAAIDLDPIVNKWYETLCRNTLGGDGQPQISAQGNPVTNSQNYSYVGDNSNPRGSLDTEDTYTGPNYFTVLDRDKWFQEISRAPIAHRLDRQYVPDGYNPQIINYKQQLQPARTPSWPVQYSHVQHSQFDSQLFQCPLSLLYVNNKAGGRGAPPKVTPYSRIKRISPKPTPGRRGGRSLPPAATDPRWNIWTLGNLDIRHTNGGVTAKHLQRALYNTDGYKRTKLDHDSLVKQVLGKRGEMRSEMPNGWNSIQGWWVHLNPGS